LPVRINETCAHASVASARSLVYIQKAVRALYSEQFVCRQHSI
jgi:hypothetical protein